MAFLNGVDANYVPLMESLGFVWRTEKGELISDLFSYFAERGVNSFRVRLWVGEEGPSRFRYALGVMGRAAAAGMRVYVAMFLSDRWADLYKQPAPLAWEGLSVEERVRVVEAYAQECAERILDAGFEPVMYQVGNEVDYGICGVFASDKKRRKNLDWLRRRVWRWEAEILKSAFRGIGRACPGTPLAIHLGKWWDRNLLHSFLRAMEDFNVEYDVLCVSFYPSSLGAGFEALEEVLEAARERGLRLVVAEYAYPSGRVRGQFWFMNRQVPGYPFTREGQARWIRDFLAFCRRSGVEGAFYWSPEVYLTHRCRVRAPPEMPLSFGWAPMALFSRTGRAKPGVKSLRL